MDNERIAHDLTMHYLTQYYWKADREPPIKNEADLVHRYVNCKDRITAALPENI